MVQLSQDGGAVAFRDRCRCLTREDDGAERGDGGVALGLAKRELSAP